MRPTISSIIAEVASERGLTPSDLTGQCRVADVVAARHEAMKRAREQTDKSLTQIGAAFGGRDHSTVLHGCKMAVIRRERAARDWLVPAEPDRDWLW